MTINVAAHLNFRNDARAALGFYRSVFGGEQMIISYADAGNVQDPSEGDQVMWGQVTADSGFRVMAYDVPSQMPWELGKNSFFVSVCGGEAGEVTAYWEKLCEGGTIVQPLAPASWSSLYGMVKDRFGVTWVLSVASEYNAS